MQAASWMETATIAKRHRAERETMLNRWQAPVVARSLRHNAIPCHSARGAPHVLCPSPPPAKRIHTAAAAGAKSKCKSLRGWKPQPSRSDTARSAKPCLTAGKRP